MNIIYILTYDCNFRCKYCDVYKHNNNISIDVINQSFIFFERNNFLINKIKFFGGEPLLKKDFIKFIINNFPKKYNTNFYITTNSTLIDNDFMIFARENNIEITFSIDWDLDTNRENRILAHGDNLSEQIINNTKIYSNFVKINQVITPKNSINFFKNFTYIYDLWVRKFNFLPAYYIKWTKNWLVNLKKWFDEIYDFYKKWNDFELINLENYSDISFFNLGIIIDTDWNIYWTNLILSWKFKKYKKDLKIWDVFNWLIFDIQNNVFIKDYINKISSILEIEYNKSVLVSVKYIDLLLNNFCNEFKTHRN